MKILAAVDGSPFTKRMLAYLAAHDDWFGGQHQYTIVNAVAAVPPRAAAVLDKAVLKAHYEEEAEKVFKPIRAFFAKQGLKADFVYKAGPAADVVVGLTEKNEYDLVVLGSHGHGSFANLVLGSVATKVLARCKTPALLIR
ncbi:universal stress protein [Rubrivivax gelatinosus]|uniref:Nucleotide-binding universal stress UspA family protein n=1 Tax=Rubrivivax gelatinosus TaxID=28068 RepID=A0A4R2M209_RUBGE|nr:universal stress protein [Rubrivivax gelatinosus]MBK1687430.1 universal stress protein UspA [Rubrivivax gelatinosus]TCP00522.1 nucleotide-binding universal stress UspA family protein [Rubrivivax gelatinosus]